MSDYRQPSVATDDRVVLSDDSADHARIWLEPVDGYDSSEGRQWCQDDVWTGNTNYDGCEPSTEYVRADIAAAAREAGRRERDAEVAGLRGALQECADDLEAYVDHQYDKPSREYPVMARRYEQDMTTVRAARAALAALAAAPGPGGDAKE